MSDQRITQPRIVPPRRKPLLAAGLYLYRYLLSPILHTTQQTVTGTTGACRFQPTCSEYAALAVHVRGTRRGSWLALSRFLRCHPFSRGGFDPVPDRPDCNAEKIHPDGKAVLSHLPRETLRHLP